MKRDVGALAGLEELRERVERLRRGRPRGAWLPEELWTEAVGWAEKLGAYRASRALGVSYQTLVRKTTGVQASGTGFVEFSGAQLLDAAGGTVVELADAAGTRLTIRLGGAHALDVAAVVTAFRGAQR